MWSAERRQLTPWQVHRHCMQWMKLQSEGELWCVKRLYDVTGGVDVVWNQRFYSIFSLFRWQWTESIKLRSWWELWWKWSHHLLVHDNADSPTHMFETSLSVEPRAQSRRQFTPSPHVASQDSRSGNWKVVSFLHFSFASAEQPRKHEINSL